MRTNIVGSVAFLVAISALSSTTVASAQFGDLKKKAEEAAKKEAEKAVKPADTATPTEPASNEAAPSQEASATAKPGEGAWLNYDFVPGARVIFFDDLAADQVGNFPQRLEFVAGNMEVAEFNKMRWLRASTASKFSIPLPEELPQKFTIEFDMYGAARGWSSVSIIGGEDATAEQTQVHYDVTNVRAGLRNHPGTTDIAMAAVDESAFGQLMHCRILADGAYMKVYFNEKRVANVPKVNFLRSKHVHFDVAANEERPMMLANFRVAASDKTMYDALAANGRVATQGILFDSGSDRIRPESTPTLKEIGKMLAEHADLKVLIEGHTDIVGDDASNMSLSERRAAAVKAHLMASYSIDGARLESKGFGESKPVAGNDTSEGRQNNRRVELVKL